MISRTFVEEIKHIITWFVNVYGQYDDNFFFQWGCLDTLSSWNPILDTLLWKSWLRPCNKGHPCAAGVYFGQFKMMQKKHFKKWLKPWHLSTRQELSNEYQHDRI